MAITVSAGNGIISRGNKISDGTKDVLHATTESGRYAFLKIRAEMLIRFFVAPNV
jgi:hypothetical protein